MENLYQNATISMYAALSIHQKFVALQLETPDGLQNATYCFPYWTDPNKLLIYNCTFNTISEFVPLLIISVSTVVMFHELRMRHSNFPNVDKIQEAKMKKQAMKIQKKFTFIVCIFFMLTFPYALISIVATSLAISHKQFYVENYKSIESLHTIFNTLCISNSCINPFVYGYGKPVARLRAVIRGLWNKIKNGRTRPDDKNASIEMTYCKTVKGSTLSLEQ